MAYDQENKEEKKEKGGIEATLAGKITVQACQQIQTSRKFKKERLAQIMENEDLYHGLIPKTIRNPFNECFPFMSGYIDYLRAKIDDDSTLLFTHQAENDLKRAKKINALYEQESKSVLPTALWDLKHRHAKYNALFSGVAIYSYYAEKTPDYKSCFEVISHYDFHCEPRGGAILENHLFCGVDNIFKNKEDLLKSSYYDKEQVKKLVLEYAKGDYKENADEDNTRNNRYKGLAQDPDTHNYIGQEVVKLVQWYTTYEGKRYYVLFNEATQIWIRICPIEEMFPDGLYPYIAWHTNDDPDVFWSKAPADDARPIAKIINTMINQELYNRQKRNYGQRAYDVDMFPNVQALADWRPDGLVPVDTKGGTRTLSSGVFEFKTGDLNGTLDLVTWLDQFTGKNMGKTSAAAGISENDKKVGVFQGEIEQVDQLINVKNKSYKTALSQIGLRFKRGLDHNLTKAIAIQVMGANGVEWTEITKEDLKTERDLNIQAVGGTSEFSLKQIKDNRKGQALSVTQAVNPQWKDRQILLIGGFTEDELKDAFSADSFAKKDLLSEAAQAEKDIVQGKDPLLNRGADTNFMQHIVDFANDAYPQATPEQYAKMSEEEKKKYDAETMIYEKLVKYAMAHEDIALENETTNLKEMIRQKNLKMFSQPTTDNPMTPVKDTVPTSIPVDNSAPVI